MSTVTEIGAHVDKVQAFIIAIMVFWFVACNAVLVYFMLRYRRRSKNDKVSTIKGNHTLEIVWTVIPTLICLVMFYYGVVVWKDLRTPPEDAMDINVRAYKWGWEFSYPELDGRIEGNVVYVPVNTPVRFVMKSSDVLHSLFIPEFRTKEDVIPSMYTYLWFDAKETGEYHIFCTEYCGRNHSTMLAKLHVLSEEDWEAYKSGDPNEGLTPVELGQKLFVARACSGCHSADGSALIGPTFQGLYGREGQSDDGSTYKADENYIAESIKYPNRIVVAGFQGGQMPAYEGQLSDQEIEALIAYIKTLQ
jgi:cytochrome c oxidase subunit 2